MTISEDMVERAARAMVLLCKEHRDRGEHLPSRLQEARAALTAALHGSPADKPCFHDEVVFLREVDAGTDNACWVISNRVDPGAVPFFRGVSVSRHDGGTTT